MLVLGLLGLLQEFQRPTEVILPAAIKQAISTSFSANELNIAIKTDLWENREYFLDTVSNLLVGSWNFSVQIGANEASAIGDYNLWFIDSYDAFRSFLPALRSYYRETQLYFYLVLRTSAPEEVYMREIKQIFSDFLKHSTVNVNLGIETVSEGVIFYTFYPFRKELECRSTQPFLSHRFFSNSSISERLFFPSKVNNFFGCRLRIRSRNELILTMGNPNTPKKLVNYAMSRLEVLIVRELASRLNLTLEIYDFTGFPMFPANGSSDSEQSMTLGQIDVIMGFFRNGPEQNHFYSTSPPYFYSYVVLAVYPHPDTSLIQAWILAPFSSETWACVVISLILITASFALRIKIEEYVFKRRKNHFGALDTLSLAIGTPIKRSFRQNYLRFLLEVLSVAALVLRATYQAELFDAFRRHNMLKPPKNVAELFEENYTIVVHPNGKEAIDELHKSYPKMETVDFGAKNVNFSERVERIALISSFMYMYTFYSTNELRNLLMEEVFPEQVCFFFPKHSFLTPKVNEIIMRMEEAGILYYARRDFDELADFEEIPKDRTHSRRKAVPLGIETFTFIFYLVILFYGIALLVFGAELLWYKYKKKTRKKFKIRLKMRLWKCKTRL